MQRETATERRRTFDTGWLLDLGLPILVSSAAIVITKHYTLVGRTTDAVLLFLVVPVLLLLAQRRSPAAHGLRPGNVRIGAAAAAVGIIASIVVVGVGSELSSDVRGYYGSKELTPGLVFETAVFMFAWEFLLRGYVLYALKPRLGPHRANAVQTIIFFLAHYSKPFIEFISTAGTGLLFGYITLRSRSVFPMAAIHTAIFLSVVYFT